MKGMVALPKEVQDACNEYIIRQIRAQVSELGKNMASVFLMALADKGKSAKWLNEFYAGVQPLMDELTEYYDIPHDEVFICRQKLKDMGVDLDNVKGIKLKAVIK